MNLPVSLTIPGMNGTANDTAHTGFESGLTDPGLSCGLVDPGFMCGLLCFAVKPVSTITSSHARGMDAYKLMKELRLNYEQEVHFLPRKTGLNLIASSVQVSSSSLVKRRRLSAYFERATCGVQDDSRISARCRDARVEDLWSLTSFFGYSTQTFVLAVNLLDRFLAMMRVR